MEPNSVWLKEEYGQKAFFPDRGNTCFHFTSDVGVTIKYLRVEGSPVQTLTSTPVPCSSNRFLNACQPGYRPVHGRKESGCNVKVIQADMVHKENKKVEFHKLGQVFIDVTEGTANINYISSVVQQKFGIDYVVVTADGLKIEDSSGTQGNHVIINHIQTCIYLLNPGFDCRIEVLESWQPKSVCGETRSTFGNAYEA